MALWTVDTDKAWHSIARFVDILFEPYKGMDGLIELASMDPANKAGRHSVWYTLAGLHGDRVKATKDMAEWACNEDAKGRNVYIGVNPRRREGRHKTDVLAAAWVWTEIDFKDVPEAEAKAKLEAAEPALMVHSGGGFHAYWPMPKLVVIPDGKGSGKAIGGLESKVKTFGRPFGADKVHNVDRILRLPGTHNHKPGRGHAPVRLVKKERPKWPEQARTPIEAPSRPIEADGSESGMDVQSSDWYVPTAKYKAGPAAPTLEYLATRSLPTYEGLAFGPERRRHDREWQAAMERWRHLFGAGLSCGPEPGTPEADALRDWITAVHGLTRETGLKKRKGLILIRDAAERVLDRTGRPALAMAA